MNRTLTYPIGEQDAGLSIEAYLKKLGCSHHIRTHLKKTPEGILQNGVCAYTSRRLEAGDVLTLHLIEAEGSEQIAPIPLPLSIVYEDEDLLIINKPADMPIHPSQGNHENTLANACAWYFQERGESFVYRCINRLDRDTTGLLILAKNMLSACLLSRMVQKREIHRTYLAIAEGTVPERGTISAPIARKDGSAIERCVDFLRGEHAVTHFERLAALKGYSLVKLQLETGRTHQIRVHMQYLGHPLPGDFIYCPHYTHIHRQALHSYQLEFPHPITGAPLCFTAPLPEDMRFFPEFCM